MLATHPTLASLGIASKLQRMQLLNRRDELLLLEDDHQEAPHQNGAQVSHSTYHMMPGVISDMRTIPKDAYRRVGARRMCEAHVAHFWQSNSVLISALWPALLSRQQGVLALLA